MPEEYNPDTDGIAPAGHAVGAGGAGGAAGGYGLASHLMAHSDGPVDVSEFVGASSGESDHEDVRDVPAYAGGDVAPEYGARSNAPGVEPASSMQTSLRPPDHHHMPPPQQHHQQQHLQHQQQHHQHQQYASAHAHTHAHAHEHENQERKEAAPRRRQARSAPRQRPFSRRTKEDVRREVEVEYQQQCTFKPRINKWKSQAGGRTLESREERMERLTASRDDLFKERERARKKEAESELVECTFQPNIGAPYATTAMAIADRDGGGADGGNRVPLEVRLHHEADKRAMDRERAKRQLEEAELESFPFKPNINPHTAAILDMTRYRPIHERVGDLQRAKNAELQRRRIQQDRVNPDLTFKPEINAESERLVHRRRLESQDASAFNVTERLVRDAVSGAAKKMKRVEAWQGKEAAEYRFHPTLTEKTQQIIGEMGDYDPSVDFLTRQEMLVEKQKKRADDRRAQQSKEDVIRCKFKPDIGASEQILQQNQPHRLQESQEERIERLSNKDRETIIKKREGISTQYYSQFKHKPEINKISQNLGRAMTVDELFENERNKRIKRLARDQQERDLKETCPFKPDMSQSASVSQSKSMSNMDSRFKVDMRDPDSMMQRIQDYRADRETKLRQTRQALEYEKLRECTFTPELARRKPQGATGPVVVRGLGR